MPEQQDYAVSRPGAGDVTNGSVDYYPMDWEIVGKEDARPDGAGGETAAAPAARTAPARCGDNQPQQTDEAGGYEIVKE